MSSSVGAFTAGSTWVKQLFFDSVIDTVAGSAPVHIIYAFGIGLISILILTYGTSTLRQILTENLNLKLVGYLIRDMHNKAARVNPIEYENSEKLDEINKAFKGAECTGIIFLHVLDIATFCVPYFIFMAIYLLSRQPLLFFCLILAFIPSMIGTIIRGNLFTRFENIIAPVRRKRDYYEKCITDREYFKETRLLGAFWFFRQVHEMYLILYSKQAWKFEKKASLTVLGTYIIKMLAYLGALVLMFYFLVNGEISPGTFGAIFSSIEQLFGVMEGAFGMGLGYMAEQIGPAHNYFTFMDLSEWRGREEEITKFDIVFDNVSFRYPNAESDAVSNVSFNIKDGETIAIVGENGAGKSTIVKLLMGIYMPTSGDIYIGGHNTREVSRDSLQRSISAVFQKYQRYKLSLKENISISDIANWDHETALDRAVEKAELDVTNRSFPEGIDTMLSKEFGGTDLSGGQWQRVALARGFFRDHNLVVLDEPTAAIDPIEETKVYKKFSEVSRGKTSVIVTHRLGSVRIAHRILVIDDGQVVDYATHEELIEKQGKYTQMYNAQAKWYE